MAVDRSSNNQATSGSGMGTALATSEEERIKRQQELGEEASSGPATIGGSSATQTSAPVKAMPKQQKAGTGSFANLKSYLQAAQGGGQQKIAQAATQQVQKLGAGAQKGVQQAQESFKGQLGAGSGAIFKGAQPGEFLSAEDVAKQAQATTGSVLGTAKGITYQAPQPVPTEPTRGGGISANDEYLKSTLGDKYSDFQKDMQALNGRQESADMRYNPITGSFGSSTGAGATRAVYEKYGIDVTKLPSYTPFDQYKAPELRKGEVATELTVPTPTQPQQYFKPEDLEAFSNIINAQYQGPASLQQAGLYEQAARKARAAQQAGELTQTAGGREQLLRDVFGRGRDYSRGASRLDALLLNASEQGVKQLQEQAKPALQSQQALQAAQNLSANEAAQRAAAIQGISSGARTAFTEARAAEEKAVDERLSQVVENWNQLPDYFKNILREREKGALALSEQEAGLLGIKAGQGLYNLTPDELIQTQAAERERLITKDELSRQLALQQLANLDVNRQLQKDLLYSDLEKAGTQTAEDVINKQAIQDVLRAQELAFQETAAGQTLVGTGSKKHRQTGKRYYADASANLKDLLQQAGYKFATTEGMTPEDIASGVTGSVTEDQDQLGLVGEALLPYGSGASTAEQAATAYADLATGGATAALRGLGLDVTGALARNLGGTVSSKYAKNIARRNAARDLQKKIAQALNTAGFTNRVALRDNEQTKARQAALEQILAARERTRG